MRASGPTGMIDSSGKKTDVTFSKSQDPSRVISYAEYADMDVLNKEFTLGKGLLIKAIKNITPEYIDSLKEYKNASEYEINSAATMINLSNILNRTKNANSLNNWDEITEQLNSDFIHLLNNIPEHIQQRNYDGEKVHQIREQFKVKSDSSSDSGILHNFKEVMCEIFCLIDIVEELSSIKNKQDYDRTKATGFINPEMDDTYLAAKTGVTFGTPSKDASRYETFISPITGKSVYYVKSPEGGKSSANKTLMKSSSAEMLYSDYPCKSPNERLIDIKNSTWKTKNALQNYGNLSKNKLLYTVGPREAYIVDRMFDRDMNFLQLSQLSHDGELIVQKKGDRQYVVDIHSGYNNEHVKSVTDNMRKELFNDMNDEHEIVVTSPKKYQRTQNL